MSKWTDFRDATETFVSKGWHAIWHGIEPAVHQAAPVVGEALLHIATDAAAAAVEAHGKDANPSDVMAASLKAGTDSLKAQEGTLITAGVNIGLQQVGALAGMMTAHVLAGPQTAPSPPVAETAPAT